MNNPAEPAVSLIRGLAEYAGGVAEATGGGKMLVLLPPEAARGAGLEETVELSPGGGSDPASDLPTSDAIERVASLLGEGGRREVWWPGELYLKTKGVENLVSGELRAVNGLITPERPFSAYLAYDTFTFRYAAVSEETEEGLVAVSANASTGAAVPGLAEALGRPAAAGKLGEGLPRTTLRSSSLRSTSRDEEVPAFAPPDVERAFEAALAEAKRLVRDRLAPFVKSLERRLRRDERRLTGYYGALAEQAGRRGRSSPEKVAEKRAAIARELDRKLRELDSRYTVKAELEAVSVSRAVLPAVLVRLVAVRRKSRRPYFAAWNPVLKGVEPLACEACRRPTRSFHLCDAHAHVFCADCAESADLRRSCPANGRHRGHRG